MDQIAGIVVEAAFQIQSRRGPGLLEFVYKALLPYEVRKRGLKVERQVITPLVYDGMCFEEACRADLIVEGKVILEIKSGESLERAHKRQVLIHLLPTGPKLGLFITFGAPLIKEGITRLVKRFRSAFKALIDRFLLFLLAAWRETIPTWCNELCE